MDKFIKTDSGGLPLRLDDLLWEQGELDGANYGIYDAIQAQLLRYGDNYIVEGCTYSAPNITAGWIMLDGELLRVDAHAGTDDYFSKVSTFDSRGDKTFKDTSSNQTYQVNRGVLNAATGSLNITTALTLADKTVQDIATNSTEQFATGNIPNLAASKITSGQFDAARIPNLDAGKITTGQFATARIPNLAASKITSGQFDVARIPNLAASKITSGTFASARIPQATESAVGGAEIATQSETDAKTDNTKFITPAKLGSFGDFDGMIRKKLQIGTWNMVSTVGVNVSYTLPTGKMIVNINVTIFADGNNNYYPLAYFNNLPASADPQGNFEYDNGASRFQLRRLTGGFFDNTAFDGSANRGYITFDLIDA